MEKLKIHWVVADKDDKVSNALGYGTHNMMMKKYCEPYIDFDDTSEIALHIVSADWFRPIADKKNILFCLSPETRVLTSDMRWVKIKDVKIGDELVGFDENLGKNNKYHRTIVRGTSNFIGKAYKIRTTEGDLIASPNHKWVIKRGNKNKGTRVWSATEDLRAGDKIVKTFPVWEELKSYEAGWMSGFLDGEGYIGNCGNGNALGFAQNEGNVLDYACSLIEKFGFTYNKSRNKNKKYPNSSCYSVQIHQGLKFVGMIRPKRLLEKVKYLWEGQRTWSHRMQNEGEIIEIIPIENQELIGTLTTTGTLIAEGFLSHNTMWEFDTLPKSYIEGCEKAYSIIVPCKFCRDLFKKALPHKKVEVCWEGIEPNTFQFYDRAKNYNADGKFRFLWVGAPNPRKGYFSVLEAIKVFEGFPNVEIYLKTTMHKLNFKEFFKNVWKHRKQIFRIDGCKNDIRSATINMLRRLPLRKYADSIRILGKHKNIFVDTRKVPREELYNLYCSANCFLMPTVGEGWGLTLTEAMATGCPCIATQVTGVEEYFDKTVGYPLKFSMIEQNLENYKISAKGAVVDTKDLIEKMVYVMMRYKEAYEKGKRASERIHSKFTWDKSAFRLYEILKGVK